MNEKIRTSQQNRAMHLMFHQLAKMLNDEGFDMRAVIKDDIDIPWSDYTVKEHLWRPVMKAYCGKDSTTKMTTSDVDKIFDIIVKAIGERCGITLAWPSIDELINKQYD
jgi:hypothetical protein